MSVNIVSRLWHSCTPRNQTETKHHHRHGYHLVLHRSLASPTVSLVVEQPPRPPGRTPALEPPPPPPAPLPVRNDSWLPFEAVAVDTSLPVEPRPPVPKAMPVERVVEF